MTKHDVLAAFAQNEPLTPDQLRNRLRWLLDRRSAYSYLLRLARQGLLERLERGRGRLAYRLTARGLARLEYFRKRSRAR